MLISPLKTTSSALSCSTFMASSSWQASASWASCPGQREMCKSASARASWGAGEGGGSDAHLLQLSHPVLKLDTHRVLLFPSRETNVLVRSHWPCLAGCRRAAAAHLKAIQEGVMTALGWEGERAQECIAACFQMTAAAKRPSSPLATNPASPRSPLSLPWAGQRLPAPQQGELGTPAAGSMWQLRCTPCHAGAGPRPSAAHRPLHLPLSPLALGHIRFSSNTQSWAADIADLPPSASYL